MAYYNELKIIDGWLMEGDGWDIWLADRYVSTVVDCIATNKPIEPAMIGYVIGQRRRHYAQVICEVCSKPIHDLETLEIKNNTTGRMQLIRLHKECYDKVEEESSLTDGGKHE